MTEYKLVVVGGKVLALKIVLHPDLLFLALSLLNSWRRGQKCVDNSVNSKSVRTRRILFTVIVLLVFLPRR